MADQYTCETCGHSSNTPGTCCGAPMRKTGWGADRVRTHRVGRGGWTHEAATGTGARRLRWPPL